LTTCGSPSIGPLLKKRSDDLRQALETLFIFHATGRHEEGLNLFHRIMEGLRTDNPVGTQGIVFALATTYYSYFTYNLGFHKRSQKLRGEGLAVLDQLNARYDKAIASSMSNYSGYFPDNVEAEYALFLENLTLFEARGKIAAMGTAHTVLARLAQQSRSLSEGMAHSQKAVEIARDIQSKQMEAIALVGMGFGAAQSGNYVDALDYGTQANQVWAQVYSWPLPPLVALLTNLNVTMGAFNEAAERLGNAAAISRQLGNRRLLAAQLHDLGWVTWLWHKDFDEAAPLLNEALVLRRQIDDKGGMAATLSTLAWIMSRSEQFTSATQLLQESLGLRNEIGDFLEVTNVFNRLAYVALSEGNLAQTQSYLEQALRSASQQDYSIFLGESLISLGLLKHKAGELDQAVELLTAGFNYHTNPMAINMDLKSIAESSLNEMKSALPPAQFTAAEAQGKSLDVKDYVSKYLDEHH